MKEIMLYNYLVRKFLQIGAIIILLLVINGLAHSIYDLWHKQDLITIAQKNLENEKKRNEELKNDLQIAQTPEFVEGEARDKLFLTKAGEKEVLVPKQEVKGTENKRPEKPNWQKWLNLFF
ncbi:MAG TPA: septum formation initiator family protein [Patescibacteria group bacterium]|nr:septum formation initiator family protein [Patescibacteria group bacterium]